MDDTRRIFEAFQEWMASCGVVFETEVGIVHRAFAWALETHAKEVGQAKILSLHAPFVVEARFEGGDEAAAAAHELTELAALRIGELGDIGQDESPEPAYVRG